MHPDIKCPKCGSEMVVRRAKKGPNAGRKFYVCVNYPECKGKVAIRKKADTDEPIRGGMKEYALKKDVRGWIKDLKNRKVEVRMTAVLALQWFDQDSEVVIPALIEVLWNDKDSLVRSIATEVLGRIRKATMPAIKDALLDKDKCWVWYDDKGKHYLWRRISDALVRMDDAVPILREILKDNDDPEIRINAAIAISRIGDEAAISALIEGLMDDASIVRQTAAESLGEIGNETAVPALRQALMDEVDDIREAAAEALKKIEGKEQR